MITKIALLLGQWATNAWAKIALAAAGIGAAMALYFSIRQAGRDSERVRILERAMAQANEKRQIEHDVARLGASDVDKRLRHYYRD